MIGLLAYGSLMHPDELAGHLDRGDPIVPVRVRGFKRSFCQEPSWRTGEADERGVLTVRPSAVDWFNAVLVCGWEAEAFEVLDHRERGYIRQTVPASSVETYETTNDLEKVRDINVYTGREEKWNEVLLPNPEYLKLCTDAAAHWGTEFLHDFLATTHVGHNCLRELRLLAGPSGA
jgi:cation transport regulator ChaC